MSFKFRLFGERIALPIFLSAGIASFGFFPNSAVARSIDREGVVAQSYDDDCGVAALRMLLQRAGVNVSEEKLLSGLKPGSSVEALTAADLADLVSALKLDLRLDVGFVPITAAAAFAESEPYLVLIKPRAFGASRAIDHFILIEGRVGTNFFAADPVLPSRVRLSDAVFARDVHGKSIDGKPYALILKLSRDSSKVAVHLPLRTADENSLFWEQAYRLPLSLPPGKVVMSIGQFWQDVEQVDQVSGAVASQRTNGTAFSFATGVGHRTELALSVARFTGSGKVRLPGETFSYNRSGEFAASLGLKHVPDVVLPQAVGLTLGAGIEWSDDFVPSAGSLNADVSWIKGNFEFGLGTMLRHDGRVAALLTPSITYQLPVKRAFVLDAGVSAPYRVGDSRPFYEVQLSVSRNIGANMAISAYYSNGILLEKGLSSRRFGVVLGYGIPRRFRRARDAGLLR